MIESPEKPPRPMTKSDWIFLTIIVPSIVIIESIFLYNLKTQDVDSIVSLIATKVDTIIALLK